MNITQSNALTMSSLEIAGLTGKRHDNVIRDIRKMLTELNALSFEGVGPAEFAARYGSGTFTKLSNPASLPPGSSRAVALSPNDTYLAVGSGTSPYLTIYSRSGDTFTKLITQPTIDGSTVTRLAWSPDGTYLAAIYQTGSRLAVWKQSGTTFTALSSPGTANLPNGIGRTCAWKDNARLAVGSSTTITLYDISSTAITRASDNTMKSSIGLSKQL